jgi:hypothetical protein
MEKITVRKRPHSESVITQRKFFKKTARGKVIKGRNFTSNPMFYSLLPVLRERYLRDDVSCGIRTCIACYSSLECTLPVAGASHPLFSSGHFILPDTNIFLSQVRAPQQSCLVRLIMLHERWTLWNRSCLHLRLSYCKQLWRKSDTAPSHCTIA